MFKKPTTREMIGQTYNPKITLLLFGLFILNGLFSHADPGIFAVSGLDIQKEYNIEESKFGLLLSALYVGIIPGALICPFLFGSIPVKYLIFGANLLNATFIGIFPLTGGNYYVLFFNRVLVGLCQAITIIFCPVWIDQCINPKQKTIWMSIYFMTFPLGTNVGYAIDVGVKSVSWKLSFYIQGICLGITAFLFLAFPKIYFTTTFAEQEKLTLKTHKSVKAKQNDNTDQYNQALISVERKRQQKVFVLGENDLLQRSIVKSTFLESQLDENEKTPLPVYRILLNIISNPTFIFGLIAITDILFIMIALQYNVTNYIIHVLKGDPNVVYSVFSIVTISAPICGSLCGGFLTTKYFSGYSGKNTIYLCFGMEVAFLLSCISNAFITQYIVFMCLFWFELFTQAFMQPIMTGILLSIVAPIERPTACSFLKFFIYIFGQLPAPSFYSLINSLTEQKEGDFNVSKGGMRATLSMSIIGVVSLFLAIVFKNISQKREIQRVKKQLLELNKTQAQNQNEDLVQTEIPDDKHSHNGMKKEEIERDQKVIDNEIEDVRYYDDDKRQQLI